MVDSFPSSTRPEAISVWGEFEAQPGIWTTGRTDSFGRVLARLGQAWGLWSVVCSFTSPNILATRAPWSHASESLVIGMFWLVHVFPI